MKYYLVGDEEYIKLTELIDFASKEDNNKININGRLYQSPQHGHWEAFYAHEEPTSNIYRCSNCGKGFADYLDDDYDYYNEYPVFFEYDRCPHCGTIMDGDTIYPTYRPNGKYKEFWKNRTIKVEEDGID